MSGILEIRNVSVQYVSHSMGIFGRIRVNQALNDVSLSFEHGEIFGLVGGSGSGKTTLARASLGLIDFTGEIIIDGRARKPGEFKKFSGIIGSVFQDPKASLDPTKTVGSLIEEPLIIHKTGGKKERLFRVDEVLESIGLTSDHAQRRISELSGGQRQRVAIGVALALAPKLLIADEPVSSLDVSVAASILNLLRELRDSMNLSMLFISHNLDVVHYLCDNVAVMQSGRVVEQADADTLVNSPRHDYTKLLLAAR